MNSNSNQTSGCDYRTGDLPQCAPLAAAYVPMQRAAEPAYDSGEALSRGTLFPGLDLPFMNIVNQMPADSTPLRELMALDFVLQELALYLDTHSSDSAAFTTYKSFLQLYNEGQGEVCGPVRPHHPLRPRRRGQLHLAEGSLALGLQGQHGGLSHVCV